MGKTARNKEMKKEKKKETNKTKQGKQKQRNIKRKKTCGGKRGPSRPSTPRRRDAVNLTASRLRVVSASKQC